MKKTILTLIFLSMMLVSIPADAKWWIFGKGKQEGVSISYMYLNKTPYQDMNGKAVIYQDSLQQGRIVINGKAKSSNGSIGSVMVSLDNKETWDNASLAKDGTFEYAFAPEKGKEYNFFLKAIDTTGKNNDIEDTAIRITLSEERLQDKVSPFLTALFKAYQDEDKKAFMDLVSENFTNGREILESAISNDFRALDQIKFTWFINSMAQGQNGLIFVTLRYERKVTAAATGNPLQDKGYTEIYLTNENGGLKLHGMKSPLLFGLSEADQISAGNIAQPEGEGGNLVIDGTRVYVGGHGDLESGTVTLCAGHICGSDYGYDFDTQTFNDSEASAMAFYKGTGLHLNYTPGVQQLSSACDLDSTDIPVSGYTSSSSLGDAISVASPECWALDYGTRGKLIFKVTSGDSSTTNPITLQFYYQR